MQRKIKYLAILLYLFNALLLIGNIEYKDPFASVHQELMRCKILLFLATLGFISYGILKLFHFIKKHELTLLKKLVTIATIFTLSILVLSNLSLAKTNYDRIECLDGISEYFQYFEFDGCLKIESRFEEDVKNGEIIYFQDDYNADLEFEEVLRDAHNIKLIGVSCTRFTSMTCYNNLVKDYIRKENEKK